MRRSFCQVTGNFFYENPHNSLRDLREKSSRDLITFRVDNLDEIWYNTHIN